LMFLIACSVQFIEMIKVAILSSLCYAQSGGGRLRHERCLKKKELRQHSRDGSCAITLHRRSDLRKGASGVKADMPFGNSKQPL
jgi:hypothetical protein